MHHVAVPPVILVMMPPEIYFSKITNKKQSKTKQSKILKK